MRKIITDSSAETYLLGRKIALRLRGGDVLAVSGELGAGKTVFIKGLAAGLGVKKIVRSPSFNLMKVYRITRTLEHLNTRTLEQLVHIDCYRLKSETEAIDLGLLDYLGEPRTVTAIEWPEKLERMLKKYKIKKIKISHLKNGGRALVLSF